MDLAPAADGGCYKLYTAPQKPDASRNRASQQKTQIQSDERIRYFLPPPQLGTWTLFQEYRP